LAVAAVAQLEQGAVTGGVGEGDLVTEPVVVPQTQLGAGCGRSRRTIARVPVSQPSTVLSSSAICAPGRGLPSVLIAGRQSSSATPAMAVSKALETRAEIENSQLRAMSPHGAGRIGTHQDRMRDRVRVVARCVSLAVLGGQLGGGHLDHSQLIGARVRHRVPRPEHTGERFAGGIEENRTSGGTRTRA